MLSPTRRSSSVCSHTRSIWGGSPSAGQRSGPAPTSSSVTRDAISGLGRARGGLPVGCRGGRRLCAALHRAQLLRRGRPCGPRLRELPAERDLEH